MCMAKKVLKLISTLSILFISNCIPEYRVPFVALVINETHSSRDGSQNGNPGIAGSLAEGRVLKVGKSCTNSYLYINMYYFKRGGNIRDAAEKADIKKISAVEFTNKTLLGIVNEDCVQVWGE
ncbi:TRL-like family protein [Leptospira wolbachii serovar Codice str. CDC]|uniref:TRL-like family protein n=2 Tax=Leptospira TaxID=171 RepID=R9A5G8_9LEPT|nr:TRL-like family protein [Leptospira wolbachii serovar Codice str. CDC]